MESNIIKFLIFLFCYVEIVSSDIYSVKIGTEKHVNLVESRFLSLTIDPKYLFANSEKYGSKESICMASLLTPAYIRIAGPSTSHLTFTNSSITYTNLNDHKFLEDLNGTKQKVKKIALEDISKYLKPPIKENKEVATTTSKFLNSEEYESAESTEFVRRKKHLIEFESLKEFATNDNLTSVEEEVKELNEGEEIMSSLFDEKRLQITNSQWKKFIHWAKDTGFDLVFALNNELKNEAGLWDHEAALDVLTMANSANVSDIFWQLGYECTNQSVDEYVSDLETLRIMSEYFEAGWKTVGGDVTPCLQKDSKTDFVDYVALSQELMNAVLLNGNSSSQELEKLTEADRLKILKLLSESKTPLWLTEKTWGGYDELFRAADWITSLGYSARNGFNVHFRELVEEELFEPTLSFYMALLYKNLVGERVLDVTMEASQAVLFAHCTSLRHQPIPGAVTLYAVNMDDAPARFSVKLSRREEGGDIMQFILSRDLNGNIIVNGKAMSHEGDIRPVVKRVRPYRTLIINLPAKSFGFWVLANTQVDACHNYESEDNKDLIEGQGEVTDAIATDEDKDYGNSLKTKRSMLPNAFYNEYDSSEVTSKGERILNKNEPLKNKLKELKSDLGYVRKTFTKTQSRRQKRDIFEREGLIRQKLKQFKRQIETRLQDLDVRPKGQLFKKLEGKGLLRKRNTGSRDKFNRRGTNYQIEKDLDESKSEEETLSRKRRSTESEKNDNKHKIVYNALKANSIENEIDSDVRQDKLWKILRQLHYQIENVEADEDKKNKISFENIEEDTNSKDEDQITLKTKLSDDTATVKYKEKSKHGILRSTVDNIVTVLGDLNNNLNRFWNAFSFLE